MKPVVLLLIVHLVACSASPTATMPPAGTGGTSTSSGSGGAGGGIDACAACSASQSCGIGCGEAIGCWTPGGTRVNPGPNDCPSCFAAPESADKCPDVAFPDPYFCQAPETLGGCSTSPLDTAYLCCPSVACVDPADCASLKTGASCCFGDCHGKCSPAQSTPDGGVLPASCIVPSGTCI